MKAFHMNRDSVRLYFTNYENRPDEEFEEIMSILKENNAELMKRLWNQIVILFIVPYSQ